MARSGRALSGVIPSTTAQAFFLKGTRTAENSQQSVSRVFTGVLVSMFTLVIDLATRAKEIERPCRMRPVTLFVSFQLGVCDTTVLFLYYAISYPMDHLPVQAIGEYFTVHADNHSVRP